MVTSHDGTLQLLTSVDHDIGPPNSDVRSNTGAAAPSPMFPIHSPLDALRPPQCTHAYAHFDSHMHSYQLK